MTTLGRETDHLREEQLERRVVHTGRILTFAEDTIRLPSGRQSTRELVVHPGAVAIVARDDPGRYLLVRQWRHAVGRALWELCAGTRERGEEPRATAERELSEETGYHAADWRDLGHHFVGPGYSTEEMFFFAADGLTAGEPHTDIDELLDVELFDHNGLRRLIAGSEVDIKTIAGLALAGVQLS